jgi:ketosteroid isomerase-like protein
VADIFVSYAREDREAIRTLAAHLAQGGWSVWWDRHILAGKDFDDVLQCELDKARAVLVAWSSHSIASRWVKAEAGEGLRREMLVPIQLDAALPPLGFRNIQTVTFAGLSLAAETPAFDDLLEALTALLGAPTPAPQVVLQPAPPQPVPPPVPPQPATAPPAVHKVLAAPEEDRVPRSRLPLAIAVFLAVAAAGYFLLPLVRGDRGRASDTPAAPSTSIPSPVKQEPPPAAKPAPVAMPATNPPTPVKPPDAQRADGKASPDADALSDAAIRDFVGRLLEAAASGDAQRVLPFYADRVDYYAMGAVGPDVIRKDKQAYHQRWPDIQLQLDGDVSVEDGNAPNTKLVRYRCVYHVGSAARNVHATGTTTTTLVVTLIDGALRIVDQKESVKAARQ